MKFVDLCDDRVYTIGDLKRDYEEFRREDPDSHADTFAVELLEIIMATINERNELDIIGPTPKEQERIIARLRRKV